MATLTLPLRPISGWDEGYAIDFGVPEADVSGPSDSDSGAMGGHGQAGAASGRQRAGAGGGRGRAGASGGRQRTGAEVS